MKHEILMTFILSNQTEEQITQCLNLLKDSLGKKLLAVYLYGSSIYGGLQKYSDIDLFAVLERPTNHKEKIKLIIGLLQISGIYTKSQKSPIEITIVTKSEVVPWYYPPNFDFQYGEWLREKFEKNIIEPWLTKEMPDLALLITQVLLASKTLLGLPPDQLLLKIPYNDFIRALTDVCKDLMSDILSDTRNVLLTYARIWSTLKTDAIRSKPAAAEWVIDRLPEQHRPVMKRAKAICIGKENEHWDDMQSLIKPCVDFIVSQINNEISLVELSDNTNKFIKLAE